MEFIEMNKIDIDRLHNYSYDLIYNTFHELIHELDKKIFLGNGLEMTDNQRLDFLAELMSYIEDEKLLNGAIEFFRDMNYLIDADSKYEEFISQFYKEDYSDFDFLKIKAIVFSILTKHDLTIHQYNFLNLNWDAYRIVIFLKDRIIEHNYSNIVNLMDINGTINYVESLKNLSLVEQIKGIDFLISVSFKINFQNNISLKSKSSIYLENERDTLIKVLDLGNTKPSNPVIESEEIKEDFKFTNNFDNVNEETLYKYFNENLVVKKYITKENLELFLKNAFENKLKNPTRIFNNPPTKEKFRKVFYNYYKDIAGKPHNKQIEYVELLGEYFIGFNSKTVKSNFNK